MNTTLQVARTKKGISLSSLYEEKKPLADEINKGGRNVMGDESTAFIVETIQLSGIGQALAEHGEKANGEVAGALEFLSEGYDHSVMFIYRNRGLAQSDSTNRQEIVQSISVTSRK